MSSLGELRTIAKSGRRGARNVPPKNRDNKAAFLFLLPWLLGLLFFTVGPMLASLYWSMTDYNLLKSPIKHPPAWVGLGNYLDMFHDPDFWNSFRITVVYVLVSVPLQLALALALALLLDRGMRGLAIYRSIFYLPSLLGGSVAISILWRQVFGKDGLVNGFLGALRYRWPWVDRPSELRAVDHRDPAHLDIRFAHGDLPCGTSTDPRDVLRGVGDGRCGPLPQSSVRSRCR